MRAPIVDTVLNRRIAALSYVGRRSGKAFTLPVAYRQRDDIVIIDVAMPDRKNWWRNFVAEPGPLQLQLRGVHRTAQATAERDVTGRVTVTAVLDELE
ncbi:nitroreductase/quinone reductase family protein [Mycobacterium sp. NPDC003323]